jgi:hypothetical protein
LFVDEAGEAASLWTTAVELAVIRWRRWRRMAMLAG